YARQRIPGHDHGFPVIDSKSLRSIGLHRRPSGLVEFGSGPQLLDLNEFAVERFRRCATAVNDSTIEIIVDNVLDPADAIGSLHDTGPIVNPPGETDP